MISVSTRAIFSWVIMMMSLLCNHHAVYANRWLRMHKAKTQTESKQRLRPVKIEASNDKKQSLSSDGRTFENEIPIEGVLELEKIIEMETATTAASGSNSNEEENFMELFEMDEEENEDKSSSGGEEERHIWSVL